MKKWLLLMVWFLLFGNVQADIRVLFRFDASGQFVHRVFQLDSRETPNNAKKLQSDNLAGSTNFASSNFASPIERGRSWQKASVPKFRGKHATSLQRLVRIAWFDQSGVELAQTEVPDPRIVHSPSHVEGPNVSQAALTEGAWFAVGPDSAVNVTVFFPEFTLLGLGSELWMLELTR